MATLADSLVASSARKLHLRMRPDLSSRRHRYQSRAYWVIKEPVGLNYFRFQDQEYAILHMLDGQTSLDKIKEQFEAEYAPQKITLEELQQFIGMLHRSGLVIADAPGQGQQLKKRRDERTKKQRLAALSNVLAIRFKGIDPEWLLNLLYPYVRWLFSPAAMWLFCMLTVSALLLVTLQFDIFRARLPAFYEFFGPSNWLMLGATLAVTKVLHELGHGMTCKHFGGECHEMGVMILVLTPCLYCNVSDSWMLRSKWQRAAIGAAGIFIELTLAALATFIWWFSEPGLLNHLALRVMFICSVSTIMFNGNPLLRYDGYYIMADVIEIPNLRQKCSSVLRRLMAHWCLGLELPDDPFLPQRNRFFFGLYTVASVTYRWVVVLSILWFLNQVFKPYGLQIIGQLITTMSLFGLIVMPLWQLGKFLYVPGRMDQVKKPRMYATMGVLAGLVLAIVFLPLPHYVKCAAQIRPLGAKMVHISEPGRLQEVLVEPGESVEKGQLLAQMSNPDLDREIVRLAGQRDEYQTRLENLENRGIRDGSALERIRQLEEFLSTTEQQLAKRQQAHSQLRLTAPIAGTVLPAPYRPEKPEAEGSLPGWSGSPLEAANLGAHLDRQDIFCQIGDRDQREVILIIDQDDIELIRRIHEIQGREIAVKVKLESFTERTFEGVIETISESALDAVPPSLSQQAGGPIATRTDDSGVQRPQSTAYQANVPLGEPGVPLRLGLRGRAKIYTGWQPLGTRLWRYLAKTFRFQL